ncbi:MAG: hypothetical protein Q8R32_02675 [bacterium]|nr:hypothetical protein [bacterium]
MERLLEMKAHHENAIKPVEEASDVVASQLIASASVETVNGPVITSQNQSGGITAGTVNINFVFERRNSSFNPISDPNLLARAVFQNQLVSGEYHTRIELTVESPYPPGNLEIKAHAPSVRRIDLVPQHGGPMLRGNSGVRPGLAFMNLRQPFGKIFLEIFTERPERPNIEWDMK